jgi:hypothetical protein
MVVVSRGDNGGLCAPIVVSLSKIQCNALYPLYINSRVGLCLRMNETNLEQSVRGKR